ncbi:hypothetical protein VQZ45_000002 [Salmonella enterica]|nr:hypothetical protein [Salmonella enterica]EEI9212335.1 hypothetical protein [Salmonella enterica subsp. enterica serovar Carrau]EEJ7417050.1 hypothetical protein [Salmonella enterica subsp. enterica serovar Sandiego]HCM4646358.1 hypothetical protein [Salmonella enterica subsp. enterica serovar Panama]EDI6983366.1 hypothetical protein [Salmonella enterica]
METTEIMLDHNWQQLCDGSVNATLQFTGAAGVHLSPDRPEEDAPVLRMVNREAGVTAPSVVWGRALWYEDTVRVVIVREVP